MSEEKLGLNDPELLVQRYFQRPSPDLKDMILVQYSSTVERLARRFSGIEAQEDLVQVGYMGLLNALKKFDPEAGVRFSTYAAHLIAGEIKHFLRDKSQIIRHPAWLQELRHKVNRTAVRLQAELGRTPTTSELAAACEVSLQAIEEVNATADLLKVTSFDASPAGDDDSSDLDNLADLNLDQIAVEDRVVLEQAMEQLRDLERDVVMRYHFDSMNQTEIAKELGISCNYVSHILRQSMSKLRRFLAAEEVSDRLLHKQMQIEEAGSVDSRIGIYSAQYFKDRLTEEVHRAHVDEGCLSVVVVKFHGLENLSSFYGKGAVTDFMIDASEFTKGMIRRLDILCLGEDNSFAIILPFTGATAAVVHDRLVSKFQPWLNARRSPAGAVGVTVGFGVLKASDRRGTKMLAEAKKMAESIESASKAA